MANFEELKNDYRSNLIIELYRLLPTLKEPFKTHYERWILYWDGQQILIMQDDRLAIEYSTAAYKINELVNHQNIIPLSDILIKGKIIYFS